MYLLRKHQTVFLFFWVVSLFFPLSAEAQQTIELPRTQYSFDGLKLNRLAPLKRPKIGLVLSGGGARGLAQIGVLKALEQHGIPIDFIAANSMGSVIGGLYAAGFTTAELENIAHSTNWEEVLSFNEGTERRELFLGQKKTTQVGYLTIRFDGLQAIIPSSFSSGQGLTDYFMNLTLKALYHPDTSFDDLKIPYRAVAVDLISGKRVVLDKGSLAEAMRSSITVPLLYTPLERDSMALIDGGLISNIPVDLAFSAGCDIVIAVNSTSGLRSAQAMQAPWEVADQIMTIVMQKPNSEQLARADVVITPKVGERLVSDFSDLHSIINAGEQAANEQIEHITGLLSKKHPYKYLTADSTLTNVLVEVEGKFIPEQVKFDLQNMPRNGTLSLHEIEDKLNALEATGEFQQCRAIITPTTGRCIVTFDLALHPMLQTIEFSGNSVIESHEIEHIIHDYEGNVLRYDSIRHMLERILSLYRSEGYALARIANIEILPEKESVRFSINEGIIHDVICEGNVRTKDYVIRREFPWEYGDVFNLSKANTGLANIYSSGLYEYLLMDVRYKNNQPVVVMKVKERSAELVRLGIHADNEHGLVGTIDFRDANFRGAGEDVSLLLRYGNKDRTARIDYWANRIFRTYLTFDFKGYVYSRDVFTYRDDPGNTIEHWERSEEGKYRETRIGGSFTFGSQLDRLGDVTAEIRGERQRISGISGTGYADEDYRIASLKIQTTLDTENKFVFPTEGIYLSLGYETALKGLGSEVSFTKISASWGMYHTFFNKHTIHPKFTLGFGDETLPLAEQYSIGGQQSFFGLQEDDSRGRQLFLGSVEYRLTLPFRILYDTYLSARYDLGTISTLPEELKFSKFRHGVGIQIGLDTPIGAAAFAVGKSFYFRRDVSEAPLSMGPLLFYFSIGPSL